MRTGATVDVFSQLATVTDVLGGAIPALIPARISRDWGRHPVSKDDRLGTF